ncbi:hypothetical protein KQI84_10115 [bacterium]|nr:hypothetical protein [bacterium]
MTDGREPKFIERQSPIYLPTEAIGMRGAKDPTEESPDNSKEKLSTEVIRPLGSGQSEARP